MVSDVGLRQEERETTRKSEREAASPENNREPSLELREATTSRVRLHRDVRREPSGAREDQLHATRPEADCGVEACGTTRADVGTPKRSR